MDEQRRNQGDQKSMKLPLYIPKPVHQTDFSAGKGNALQAAVASIYGMDLNEVPNFIEIPEGYESAIRKFCHEISNCSTNVTKISLLRNKQGDHDSLSLSKYDEKLCILRGKSPRGSFGHVVVARAKVNLETENSDNGDAKVEEKKKQLLLSFNMVHDPHPDGNFLDKTEDFGWCMFFTN